MTPVEAPCAPNAAPIQRQPPATSQITVGVAVAVIAAAIVYAGSRLDSLESSFHQLDKTVANFSGSMSAQTRHLDGVEIQMTSLDERLARAFLRIREVVDNVKRLGEEHPDVALRWDE